MQVRLIRDISTKNVTDISNWDTCACEMKCRLAEHAQPPVVSYQMMYPAGQGQIRQSRS